MPRLVGTIDRVTRALCSSRGSPRSHLLPTLPRLARVRISRGGRFTEFRNYSHAVLLPVVSGSERPEERKEIEGYIRAAHRYNRQCVARESARARKINQNEANLYEK